MLRSIPVAIIGVTRAIETTALFVLAVVQIYNEKEVLCPERLPSNVRIKSTGRSKQQTGVRKTQQNLCLQRDSPAKTNYLLNSAVSSVGIVAYPQSKAHIYV